MPSSNIESCARVSETVPDAACGQTKRPRSSRLENRHNPSPSNQRTLIKSPRRPRNTNTCPENGLCSSLCLHQPTESREAATQVGHARRDQDPRVGRQRHHARRHSSNTRTKTGLRCLRCAPALGAVRCEWCWVAFSQDRRPLARPRSVRANSHSPEKATTSSPPSAPQVFCLVEPTPTKQLVCVHPVCPRHPRHRRAGRQCLFNNPPLLGDVRRCRTGPTGPCLSWEYCYLLGSVHSLQVETISGSFKIERMALIVRLVQTASAYAYFLAARLARLCFHFAYPHLKTRETAEK